MALVPASSLRGALQCRQAAMLYAPLPRLSSSPRIAAAGMRLNSVRPSRTSSVAVHARASSTFTVDGKQYSHPAGAVQQLPVVAQAAVFVGIFAALAASTYAVCTQLNPWLAVNAPSVLKFGQAVAVPLPALVFIASGVAHFTKVSGFEAIYPPKGTWGVWYLPGSPRFHVYWTGVAEILGGLGLVLGALPQVQALWPGLQQLAALGLFYLTIAVTPANIHMATHNAPVPFGPYDKTVPPAMHIVRFALQVLLLAGFWGIAHA